MWAGYHRIRKHRSYEFTPAWRGSRVPQHIAELLLDHRSGATISGVAAIYNRYNYQAEMRASVDRWENRVVSLANQNVVRFEKRVVG